MQIIFTVVDYDRTIKTKKVSKTVQLQTADSFFHKFLFFREAP